MQQETKTENVMGRERNKSILTVLLPLMLALLMPSTARAQGDSLLLRYQVRGSVCDAKSGHRLQYVSVSIPGKRYSTVTNSDGEFVLKTNEPPKEVLVSHVGYNSRRASVTSDGKPLTIRLEPNTIQLKEVLVMAEDPMLILTTALDKVKDNYITTPEMYRCFYRETAQKRSKYIYIAEAVTDLYKTAYTHRDIGDRVSVVKDRRLLSPKSSDTLSVKVLGGPTFAVSLDLVKNREFLLNSMELELYSMKMGSPTVIDDRMQYVIELEPGVSIDRPLYYGKIYVDRETLAFTRIELSLDVSNRDLATQFMLFKKPLGLRFKPREQTLLVNYKYEDGVTRLSYVRSTFRFACDWKRRLFNTNFTAVSEVVVTDRDESPSQTIKRKEAYSKSSSLYDTASYTLDEDFWSGYNIIEPTESLEKAVRRLYKEDRRR